jgi:hypothetical protein
MTDLKYFDYGFPTHPALPTYGLYQPVLDCFIVVHPSLWVLNRLRSLLTPRYNTFTVCLNTADNFYPGLIDNSVCENWTFENVNQLNINVPSKIFKNDENIHATKLVQKTSIEDIFKEKQWALFCIHWIRILDKDKNYSGNDYKVLDNDLKDIVNCQELSYVPEENRELQIEILRLLYQNTEFDSTNEQILKIAHDHGLDINV